MIDKLKNTIFRKIGADFKLPNFLLVGYPKCGTTSLYSYLKQHSEVFLPKQKELHFFSVAGADEESLKVELFPFDSNINSMITRTIEEYKGHFIGANRYDAVGEMTPSYAIMHERSISNIKKFLPNYRKTKIILVIRDPVKACISHYNMQKNRNIEYLSLEDSINQSQLRKKYGHYRRDHVNSFMYAEGIKAFKNEFDNVLVILSDDLKHKTKDTLRSVCDFLEIDPNYKFNVNSLANVGKYNPKSDFSELDSKIRPLFEDDIKQTEEITGFDLSTWRSA